MKKKATWYLVFSKTSLTSKIMLLKTASHISGANYFSQSKSFLLSLSLSCCDSFNTQRGQEPRWGCRHSSVVLSAPTILQSWVRVPSTPSMLLMSNCVLYLSLYWEKEENKQKEAYIKKNQDSFWCENVINCEECLWSYTTWCYSVIFHSGSSNKHSSILIYDSRVEL